MIYFNTTKQNIVDAISKKVFWAFEINIAGSGISLSSTVGANSITIH